MDKDLDKIEEDLKKEKHNKKERRVSGRSVFKLQEIIKEKSQNKIKDENEEDK